MLRITLMSALLFLLAGCASAERISATPPAPQDHPRLLQIHAADQAARATQPIDWDRVAAMDAAHREEALALLRAGEVRTANDLYHAAMVMQHGSETADYQLAFSLARLAMTLDPSSKRARWLSAAAWDRILMSRMSRSGTERSSTARVPASRWRCMRFTSPRWPMPSAPR